MTDAATAHDKIYGPPIQECGPGKTKCRIFYADEIAFETKHVSCPNHADACAAGPYLMDANTNFKRRVLTRIRKIMSEYGHEDRTDKAMRVAFCVAIKAIRDMDNGMWADAVRRGKKNDKRCATCGGVTSCISAICKIEPGRRPYGDHCSCHGKGK